MEKRLAPLFAYISDAFGAAMGKALSWVSENYSWDWSSMSFAQTEKSMAADYGKERKKEEEALAGIQASEKKTPQLEKELEKELGKKVSRERGCIIRGRILW